MDESDIDLAVKDYLLLLKTSANIEQKLNLLAIITDIINHKKLPDSTSKQLIEAVDYECMQIIMDSSLLDTCHESLSKDKLESSCTKGVLTKLVEKYIETNCTEDIMAICSISSLGREDTWLHDCDALESLLVYLTNKLAFKQEKESFEVCDWLCQIVPKLPLSMIVKDAKEPWQADLYRGLYNMILSKLSPKHRNVALKLASVVSDYFKIDWLLSKDNGKNLFIVIVNLACIEIRLFLECQPYKDVVENYAEIRASYTIVEIASHYLISDPATLSDKNVQQLNESLKQVLDIIISFIKYNLPIGAKSDMKLDLFIILTVKLFSALIVEEDRNNNKDMVNILPFIMQTVCHQFRYLGNEELVDCIMPGICVLTYDEAIRKTLLQLKVEELLLHYIKHQWKKSLCNEVKDKCVLEQSMEKTLTACNIFLNILTYETDRVKSVEIYNILLKFIMSKTYKIPTKTEFIPWNAMFCTVGMAILEQSYGIFEENDDTVFSFIQCVITFLWGAFELREKKLTVNPDYVSTWETVIDPWLLTMKYLSGVLEISSWIGQYCIDCEWPTIFVGYLMQAGTESVNVDIINSFEKVYITLYRYSEFSKPDPQRKDIKIMAKKHHMKNLLAVIT